MMGWLIDAAIIFVFVPVGTWVLVKIIDKIIFGVRRRPPPCGALQAADSNTSNRYK